ncbi:MAG: recombinase family protein [Oscillospiraceae bacterium]|jgi:DNA invertase Pin-like site-specific DNA recombinase|nr:recombinase family protein [Oscillospiraceae bacterium]
MKKVILYCRIASSNQAEKELDIQEQGLRNYAEAHNYEVVEVIKEIESGANLNRPGINKILEMANRHTVDMIIAKNISRYGRCAVSELNSFIEKLTTKGVEVIALAEGDLQKVIPILKEIV